MSDYEQHSGKIRIVKPLNSLETIEQQEKRLSFENGCKEEEYYEGWLFEELYKKYLRAKGGIWEIFDHIKEDESDSFIRITDNKDGTYSFQTRFYNGGTCMSEMIEYGITDIM